MADSTNASVEARTSALLDEWRGKPEEIVQRYAWRTMPARVLPPGDLARAHAFEAWADELPGHVATAGSAAEALRIAIEEATSLVRSLLKDGKHVPIPLVLMGRTQQVSLKLTIQEAAEIDAAAARSAVARSDFIRRAALDAAKRTANPDRDVALEAWNRAAQRAAAQEPSC